MFTFPIARNVDQARRQANIADRAKNLFESEDYYWYTTATPGVYGVVKRSFSEAADTSYAVTIDPAASCTCPDFQKHGDFCKHTVALYDALEEEATLAQYEAEGGDDRYALDEVLRKNPDLDYMLWSNGWFNSGKCFR